MKSTALRISNLAPDQRSSVGEALQGLAVAGHRLVVALWAAAGQRASVPRQKLTLREEADELRAFACTIMTSDPGFAGDLFAAADRHESGQRA